MMSPVLIGVIGGALILMVVFAAGVAIGRYFTNRNCEQYVSSSGTVRLLPGSKKDGSHG